MSVHNENEIKNNEQDFDKVYEYFSNNEKNKDAVEKLKHINVENFNPSTTNIESEEDFKNYFAYLHWCYLSTVMEIKKKDEKKNKIINSMHILTEKYVSKFGKNYDAVISVPVETQQGAEDKPIIEKKPVAKKGNAKKKVGDVEEPAEQESADKSDAVIPKKSNTKKKPEPVVVVETIVEPPKKVVTVKPKIVKKKTDIETDELVVAEKEPEDKPVKKPAKKKTPGKK